MLRANQAKTLSLESMASEAKRIAEICEDKIREAALKGKCVAHFRDLGYEKRKKYKEVLESHGYKVSENTGVQHDPCDILTVEW